MARVTDSVHGEVRVPGDKSVSHRALIFSAFASGTSRVRGILQSDDVKSTAGVLRTLGWAVPEVSAEMVIDGAGFTSRLPSPVSRLQCNNSGTTARLMAGVAAAQPFASTFVGDPSLSRRPMRRVSAPLEAMGARVEFPDGHDGLPMTIHGAPLRAIDWELPVASAQVKSAILLAGLCGRVPVRVREPAPTRDHTERMLAALGAGVTTRDGWIELQPADRLAPLDLDVPGDPSSAAFFVARALLADEGSLVVRHVLRSPFRDGFLHVVRRMGARIEEVRASTGSGERRDDLVVHAGSGLRAVAVGRDEVTSMIDEVPMLAVLAARAVGTTVVRGAEELRVKESDRIAAVVANLRAVGVEAEELPDGLVVHGTEAPLSGRVLTHADHRIAMAFGILGASRGCTITVDDPSCVAVSYPHFWEDLAHVAR
ncbi:MAG: 3-phosphoshikimate 1-carboxyvinyltransferase [Gemmatimonadetes bacterium SCN 70-22]|nr:MAG: 3-phosphoshikimate 1-carboxyvinyltransferase [Gemmatimonadetes bacterium SCN 70-22]